MKYLQLFSSHVRSYFSFLVIFFLLICSWSLNGQSRFSLDLRPGVDVATKLLGDYDLKAGYGIEGNLAYEIISPLSVYGGWSWNHFANNTTNDDFDETGYSFGLQAIHQISYSNIYYLLRGGALWNHIEMENTSGDIISDTGHGWGWQAEIGTGFSFGDQFMILPSIRYRTLSRDMVIDNNSSPVDLNYISAGIGLKWIF